jgi:hypothetical protein
MTLFNSYVIQVYIQDTVLFLDLYNLVITVLLLMIIIVKLQYSITTYFNLHSIV